MASELRGVRVLVVDDEEFPRMHLVGVLRQLGAEEIVEAEDGVAALARLGEGGVIFDLLISDIEMPNLDGWELARRLREDPPPGAEGIAILLISGGADARPGAAADLTVLGPLAKPATEEALAPLLARAGFGAGAKGGRGR